jgi:hypothetical protein
MYAVGINIGSRCRRGLANGLATCREFASVRDGVLADFDAIAPTMFGAVQRGIGACHEGFECVVFMQLRATAAESYIQASCARRNQLVGKVRAQALADLLRSVQGRVRQEGDEFLATPTTGEVGCTQAFRHARRHFAQNFVTDAVTVVIVDEFEMIQIEYQDRQRFAVSARLFERTLRLCIEMAAIGDAGQCVLFGKALELALGQPPFRDVVVDADDYG